MRLVNFERKGERCLGALHGETVVDLSDSGLPNDTIDLIAQWDLAKAEHAVGQGSRMPLAGVRLLAPILPRKNIIAVGRNYRDHAREFSDSGFDASEKQMIPEHPVIFTKAPTAVIGPDESIVLANDPTGTTDYEGEMAVVIGRTARNISPEEALDHVFGWTIVNDVTARALQDKNAGYTRAKGFDTFAPLGPCIAQGLDYSRPEGLRVEGLVNGTVRQNSSTKELIFTIPMVIAFISNIMTLLPGVVIATGTPTGIGPLNAGDTVTIRVEGVGELTNEVHP